MISILPMVKGQCAVWQRSGSSKNNKNTTLVGFFQILLHDMYNDDSSNC